MIIMKHGFLKLVLSKSIQWCYSGSEKKKFKQLSVEDHGHCFLDHKATILMDFMEL